jgi:hypothetical protein
MSKNYELIQMFIIFLFIIMIRRTLTAATQITFNKFTYKSKALFFGQQPNFDSSKDYYLTLGVSKNAN